MLGVPRSATDEQIKTAYRKLILKFHPDKNVGDTYFEDWSKKIIEAFEVLSNPQLRAEYDQVYDEHRQAAKKPFRRNKQRRHMSRKLRQQKLLKRRCLRQHMMLTVVRMLIINMVLLIKALIRVKNLQ